MLLYVLDRCLTATVIYLIFAGTLITFRDYIPHYFFLASLALSTIWIVKNNAGHIDKELRIERLGGGRAPRVRTWTPSNVGFILKAITYFKQNKNHELWWDNFRWAGKQVGKEYSWTHETVVLGNRLILTADEHNIKAILAIQFNEFEKGEQFYHDWKLFLGSGIFNADGEIWQHSRALLRPQFAKERVSDLQIYESHIQELLPLLRGASPGATVRVDDLLQRFTLDSACDFLFNFNVGSLKNADVAFARTFNDVQHVQATIARAGPLKAFIPKKRYYEAVKELHQFVDHFIDQVLAMSPEELAKRANDDGRYTFLEALALDTRNRDELYSHIVSVLLAGRDTTSASLTWLLFELSRRPDIVADLRGEIESFVGLDPSNKPTYSSLKSMRKLTHVLNEGQRMYSTVPFNVRSCKVAAGTTLPRGGGKNGDEPLAVLKDTQVGFSTFVMHNRPDLYPKDGPPANVFAPERWETYRGTIGYAAFSLGPRLCLGQQMALTEMGYTLVRILQHFPKLENRMDGHPMYKTDIVLMPAKPIEIGFFE